MRILCAIALLALGCAHAHVKQYDPQTGNQICGVASWVLGTGEIEQVSDGCGNYANSTSDTGFSDNAEPVLGAVTEGAMKALVPVPLP